MINIARRAKADDFLEESTVVVDFRPRFERGVWAVGCYCDGIELSTNFDQSNGLAEELSSAHGCEVERVEYRKPRVRNAPNR